MESYEQKKIELNRILAKINQPICTFSGGVDSALLAFLCRKQNPATRVIFAEMPTLSKEDISFALSSAAEMQLNLEVIPFHPLSLSEIANNTELRCYYCKHLLFSEIRQKYPEASLTDGSNADDIREFRPGKKALIEFDVKSPLVQVGFTKQDIRSYAAELNLPAANRRSKPCLLTRFPYHLRIQSEMLKKIEAGENYLSSLFNDNFRLRWVDNHTCRIEATPTDCSLWEHHRTSESFPFKQIILAPTEHCSGTFDNIRKKETVL